MVEIILLIMAIIPIQFYIMAIKERFGVLPSISDSYYHLKGKQKLIFTLILWALAFPICFISVYQYDYVNWLMFSAGSLIMLVGVSPAFKHDKFENILHMIGAYGGVILSLLSIGFEYGSFLYTFSVVIILIFLSVNVDFKPLKVKLAKNYIWYAEEIVIWAVWVYLLFNSLLFFYKILK